MSAKGLFSFRNDKILQTQILDGIILRMERIGLAVARVYFIDEGSAEIPVPEGFQIQDHSNGDIPVLKFPGRQKFFLGWADNYSLLLNGVLVVRLINQRQWEIQGHADRQVFSIDN